MPGDVEAIAKDWYTGQRGRVVGNTVPWDDLTTEQRYAVTEEVKDLLDWMKELWQWPKKP